MKNKEFTTFEQQVEILKDRGLLFVSEETALNALRRFGYYNIINGYKEPYIEKVNGLERYKSGTTFEQIFSLYNVDKTVRNLLLNNLLEVEENLKTATAHVISETYGEKQEDYLNKKNYKLGKLRDGEYQLDGLMKKFNKIAADSADPYCYYRNTYNNVPPWVLFKGASFGNIVNFIKLQKSDVKSKIISLVYGFPLDMLKSLPELKDVFSDTMFICLQYRNAAAHGSRIYNYVPSASFRYSRLLHSRADISNADYRNGKGHSDIFTLLHALSFFDNQNVFYKLKHFIDLVVDDHCQKYPNDYDYLIQYLKTPEI